MNKKLLLRFFFPLVLGLLLSENLLSETVDEDSTLLSIVKKALTQKTDRNVSDSGNVHHWEVQLEIDALIFNETRTITGQEFYELFYTLWIPPEKCKNFSITISEKSISTSKSLIIISINEFEVGSLILKPRLEGLEEQIHLAIDLAKGFLTQLKDQEKLLQEEMKGSGLF